MGEVTANEYKILIGKLEKGHVVDQLVDGRYISECSSKRVWSWGLNWTHSEQHTFAGFCEHRLSKEHTLPCLKSVNGNRWRAWLWSSSLCYILQSLISSFLALSSSALCSQVIWNSRPNLSGNDLIFRKQATLKSSCRSIFFGHALSVF
jgi:hypothetical protein